MVERRWGHWHPMKAVTWQGKLDMQVVEVPDAKIEERTDVVIEVTSTGLCGSDLHLYDPLTPFMTPGDIVGHEPMGIVRDVGSAVTTLSAGDRTASFTDGAEIPSGLRELFELVWRG